MGSLLLIAGKKDLRFACPTLASCSTSPPEPSRDRRPTSWRNAKEILNLKKRLNEIYVHHTGQPTKKIDDALERDYFLLRRWRGISA